MSPDVFRSVRRGVLCLGLLLFAASMAVGQVRNQSGGSGVPLPPAPGQPVRNVPNGWVATGTASVDAPILRREYIAAYNRYTHAISTYPPTSSEVMTAMQEFKVAEDTYYRKGLVMVRVTPSQAAPPGTGHATTQPPSGPPSTMIQLSSVAIPEKVKIDEKEFQPFEQDVSQTVSGPSSWLSTVWVTVHGRVTDHMGNPVRRVTVKLTVSGESDITDANGKYSASFQHDGFQNVSIPLDITLDPRCLVVTPRVASFGTVALGVKDSFEYVSVENTCPNETVDVTFGARVGPFFLKTVDCTAGQGEGVIWNKDSTKMIMGPGSRCRMRLSFEPVSQGSWDKKLYFAGSDVPGLPVALRALGTATDVVLVGEKQGHFSGTTSVGSSSEWTITITNGSPSSPLEIIVSDFDGVASGDFDARIVAVTGLPPPPLPPPGAPLPPPGPLVPHPRVITLPPGAVVMVVVKFEPQAEGLREAVLVFETSDPSVPVVKVPVSGIGN